MTDTRSEELKSDKSIAKHLDKAVEWLLDKQQEGGFWNAEVETNCCMEAQWLMAIYFCGIDHHKKQGVIDYILNCQREDGAWDVYTDAPNGDINTTLECYVALRLSGFSKDGEVLTKARAWLLKNKWHKHIRVFTKYWLALFGEWKWEHTPDLPPEIIYFPKWFPFNIYNFSAWARASMMPLTIVSAIKPVKELPPELRLDELYPEGREAVDYRLLRDEKISKVSWKKFFLTSDRLLHVYTKLSKNSRIRKHAMKSAMEWILSHQDDDGYWGGIQPPWIYGIIAMHILGYSKNQVNMARALNAVDLHWSEKTPKGIRIKASESPVWDTMLSVNALLEAGLTPSCKKLSNAVDYLLNMENRHYGDWSNLVGRKVEPSGWSFQRSNVYYPDIDDTAVAMLALKKFKRLLPSYDQRAARIDAALRRAANWIIAMQSKNGAWAAFDRDNTKAIITKLPFCDFGEVLDPPSSDVTAHVIEALVNCGYDRKHPVLQRALEFLYKEQESDGSWFGRWGINYIYGTWCVLTALAAAGDTKQDEHIKRALNWIYSRQNRDGGWGESAASYMAPLSAGDDAKSTASQTAWALIALLNFEDKLNPAIKRGIEFLKSTQFEDGSWYENEFTGTGFPGYGLGAKVDLRAGKPLPQGKELSRGFMLRYGYYCQYFPIVALSLAKKTQA